MDPDPAGPIPTQLESPELRCPRWSGQSITDPNSRNCGQRGMQVIQHHSKARLAQWIDFDLIHWTKCAPERGPIGGRHCIILTSSHCHCQRQASSNWVPAKRLRMPSGFGFNDVHCADSPSLVLLNSLMSTDAQSVIAPSPFNAQNNPGLRLYSLVPQMAHNSYCLPSFLDGPFDVGELYVVLVESLPILSMMRGPGFGKYSIQHGVARS